MVYKDKKSIVTINAFQNDLNVPRHKPKNHIVREIYIKSIKSRLQDNDVEMHSTYN